MESKHLTWGQTLAAEQLFDIVAASDGAIEVVQIEPPSAEGGSLSIRLSIETGDYEFRDGGFRFRRREPLRVFVPSGFPNQAPTADFAHQRFKGYPHVQWGYHLCLYQATDTEWAASDGMFGFIKRLDQWLRDAALNQLDPNDAPLHPPIAYPSSDTKFAIEINPPEIQDGHFFWIGAAKLKERNKYCFDVAEWTETPKEFPQGERLAAVVLLNQAMPMEYPDTVDKLINVLQERGISLDFLFSILKLFSLVQKEDEPLYFILGAPMRRRAAGEPLRQHLTAWKIEAAHVKALRAIVGDEINEATVEAWKLILKWAIDAKTDWCLVYDNRPELTFRRDQGTNASWFLGKSVALLGCGALGSHIGEYLIRAGVSKLRLVDYSAISPGILVRQQFRHYQVGYSKQSGLAVQLKTINPNADIDHEFANLSRGWPDALPLEDFDLVIDTTASRRVASALQDDLSPLKVTPPILRCAIDGKASLGIANLKMPRSQFGPSDLVRQSKLAASDSTRLNEFARSFWPPEQQEPGFQPEPGCSEPTFVGSAADIAFFASSFFNFAARALDQATADAASAFFVSAPDGSKTMASHVVDLGSANPAVEALHGYRVLVSPNAKKAIESEIRTNARIGSPRNETGGLLLGEIDDSLRSISIDIATGPPPDSEQSPELFLCGVDGTERTCEYHASKSGGSTRFVGVWHTHPVSMPRPSEVDLGAMAQILYFQEKTPWHVVMLIVGYASTRPVWRFHLFRKNQFQFVGTEDEVAQNGA